MRLRDPGHYPADPDARPGQSNRQAARLRLVLRYPLPVHARERYELAGDDGGTRLTHSCTLRGALSLPFAAMMLRRLRSLMIEADDRLATYLRWRVGQPTRGINRQRVPSRYRRKAR